MFTNINVDYCKTLGCKNMGILNSPDYVLQGESILCQECGFQFPVISATALNLYRHATNQVWKGVIKLCPSCGSNQLKKHGFSSQGGQRMYCCHCCKTFILAASANNDNRRDALATLIQEGASISELRSILRLDSTGLNRELFKLSRCVNQAECHWDFPSFDIVLSTRAFRVKYNKGDCYLYVLVTAEELNGRVVAISSNYSARPVEESFQYHSKYEERMPQDTLTHMVQRKEAMTMRRPVLFDVDYGPALLYKNDPGMIVKPVLTAYRHFELVHILTDERSLHAQHFLEHECFILGGCMAANLLHIRQGRCHISFVRERGHVPPHRRMPPRLFTGGGIRNNIWRTFSTRDYAIAVCNLTEDNKSSRTLGDATLISATKFVDYVYKHPFFTHLGHLSPENVTSALNYIKYEYNQRCDIF